MRENRTMGRPNKWRKKLCAIILFWLITRRRNFTDFLIRNMRRYLSASSLGDVNVKCVANYICGNLDILQSCIINHSSLVLAQFKAIVNDNSTSLPHCLRLVQCHWPQASQMFHQTNVSIYHNIINHRTLIVSAYCLHCRSNNIQWQNTRQMFRFTWFIWLLIYIRWKQKFYF